MAVLPERRIAPDLTIPGAGIDDVTVTAEYGWLTPEGEIIWESSGRYPWSTSGMTKVRRIRHVIVERIKIIDGPDDGAYI